MKESQLMRTMMMAMLTMCILVAWPTSHSNAAVLKVQAKSCTYADVLAAVTYGAGVATAVVNIPAGECDWGVNELTVPGGVSLNGAGSGSTIIRGSDGSDQLITIDCTNGKTSSFSNITLSGKGNPAIWDDGLLFTGGCKNFKVFNSVFSDFVNAGVSVYSDGHGVIYKNKFINNYRAGQTGGTTGYGVVVYGDSTWPALDLGSNKAVFVEDNYFYGNRHNIASNDGSRYVFRYNEATVTGPAKNFAQVDAHGISSSPQGSRSWEVYNNTFSAIIPVGALTRTAIGMGGGDGVIFNNILNNPEVTRWAIELWTPADAYPGEDQVRAAYFWNNSPGATSLLNIDSPTHFVEGRDYFLYAKPGYSPYPYPHPLRAR